MFGTKLFILKALFLWITVSGVLVESATRHKKDVHHMIILQEEGRTRPAKNHRYRPRPKRRPTKPKYHHSKEDEEESFSQSDSSSNESSYYSYKKPQTHKKKHKKGTKKDHQWTPMNSKELLFGNPQMVPIEITTPPPPFGMPNNLLSFGGIPSNFQQFTPNMGPNFTPNFTPNLGSNVSPMMGAVEPYKPFDYSVLDQNHNLKDQKWDQNKNKDHNKDQDMAASNKPSFAIVMDEATNTSKEERKKKKNGGHETKLREPKGRGSHRLRIKTTQ